MDNEPRWLIALMRHRPACQSLRLAGLCIQLDGNTPGLAQDNGPAAENARPTCQRNTAKGVDVSSTPSATAYVTVSAPLNALPTSSMLSAVG